MHICFTRALWRRKARTTRPYVSMKCCGLLTPGKRRESGTRSCCSVWAILQARRSCSKNRWSEQNARRSFIDSKNVNGCRLPNVAAHSERLDRVQPAVDHELRSRAVGTFIAREK